MGVWGQNRGRGDAILTPKLTHFYFWGSYVCANFGQNPLSNATVRVPRRTHWQTDRRKPNL